MADYAVEVCNVDMRFNLAKERVDGLKEYCVRLLKGKLLFEEFYALKNVSFQIKKGESFAVLGSNGSGKSTMLKLISGIYKPTRGTISVNGSIAPLIELGAGFDQDLTARENVFLNGAVLGYGKRFMQEHYDEIIDFAEIKEFEDVPIKNHSSGMRARLGFAIATIVKPEILIVDEILSVGDFNFKKKSQAKMGHMMDGGTTLILVSHSFEQVKSLCERATWINRGEQIVTDNVERVCNAYMQGKLS